MEGPDRHILTCRALTAPRYQANTESIASLKIEENESAIQTPGRDECPDPKRSAHNSAQIGHTAQWRYGQQAFQRGNHIGQGGHEGNQESVSSPSRSALSANAQQEQSRTLTKPQRPRWGRRQHPLWISLHIWTLEENWCQQQGWDRCGEMPWSRASQMPPSAATHHRCPVHWVRSSS